MRVFLTLMLLLTLLQGVSAKNILHCLAEEEMELHQSKSTGARYKLNQFLIDHLSGLTGVRLKNVFFNKICKNQKKPSLRLLEEIIINRARIFDYQSLSSANGAKSYQKAAIQTLLDSSPRQFFAYISALQAKASTANCLTKEIPEIHYFMERYMHLEGEIKIEKLLNDPRKIKTIFQKLTPIGSIYRRCAKR